MCWSVCLIEIFVYDNVYIRFYLVKISAMKEMKMD